MLKRLLAVLAVLALSGCASKSLQDAKVMDAQQDGSTAVLVGTFSHNITGSLPYQHRAFYFKNLDSGRTYTIKASTHFMALPGMNTPYDFENEASKTRGSVFFFRVPAGKYVFYNYEMSQQAGMISMVWKDPKNFSIPFEVQPDRVNYVGEVLLKIKMTTNFVGLPDYAGGQWFITDQIDRDLALINKVQPTIPTDNVVNIVPSQAEISSNLVTLQPKR